MTGEKRSEKRKRTEIRRARFTPEEAAAFDEKAAEYGGDSAFIRNRTIGAPPPRNKIDVQLLSKVLAGLGKVGSNINQYTKSRNMGRESDNLDLAMEAALRELLEWRMALMQALGLERPRKPPKHD